MNQKQIVDTSVRIIHYTPMKTTGLILATLASLASAQDDGECNIRECGCPPYREKWCDKNNARVFSPICQISKGFCDYTCGEVWCGKSPTPPKPPAPKIHMYHLGDASDIHCYQTNYTDPFYKSLGYVDGFCPFQLVDSEDTLEVCNGHANENTKYCPKDIINITVYKMGKSR